MNLTSIKSRYSTNNIKSNTYGIIKTGMYLSSGYTFIPYIFMNNSEEEIKKRKLLERKNKLEKLLKINN